MKKFLRCALCITAAPFAYLALLGLIALARKYPQIVED